LIGIILGLICQIIIAPSLFEVNPRRYGVCAVIPVIGTLLGFTIAAIFKRSWVVCRTIALETGSQNVSIALSVISMSYPSMEAVHMTILPVTYYIFLMIMMISLALAYKTRKFLQQKSTFKLSVVVKEMTIGYELAIKLRETRI